MPGHFSSSSPSITKKPNPIPVKSWTYDEQVIPQPLGRYEFHHPYPFIAKAFYDLARFCFKVWIFMRIVLVSLST